MIHLFVRFLWAMTFCTENFAQNNLHKNYVNNNILHKFKLLNYCIFIICFRFKLFCTIFIFFALIIYYCKLFCTNDFLLNF